MTITHDPTVSQTMPLAEAAEVLGCGKSTLYEMARTTGELCPGIPFIRIGQTGLRLPRERVEAYARGDWQPVTGAGQGAAR